METPKEKLANILSKQGWRLEQTFVEDLEWWADEIWEIRSIWSPEGVPAYITFLVDSQYKRLRNKGQGVWGVGNSLGYPSTLKDAQSNGIATMNEISKTKAHEFIQNIESLRSEAIDDNSLRK